MAMVKLNQYGITLIELLLTVAILSIVGGIVWGIFFQGVKYSNDAVTINQMQQESNIIITKLKEIHQTSEEYTIQSNNGIITVTYTDKFGSTQVIIFENSNFDLASTQVNKTKPKETDTLFTVIVTDKKSDNSHSTSTLLYRLKGGKKNDS